MCGGYAPKMNPDTAHTPDPAWDEMRASHWHSALSSAPTAARDAGQRALKPKAIASRAPLR